MLSLNNVTKGHKCAQVSSLFGHFLDGKSLFKDLNQASKSVKEPKDISAP